MSKLLKEVILPKNEKKHISQEFKIVANTLYLQLSSHTPPRQYPLLPSSPSGGTLKFQVPETDIPPPTCNTDEKMYEVFPEYSNGSFKFIV